MQGSVQTDIQTDDAIPSLDATTSGVARINSEDLFQHAREIEIAHRGRIYRLRLTQLDKLILTA